MSAVPIESDPEITRASRVLQANGVRLLVLDGIPVVGLWSDLDGPHIRAALARLGNSKLPIRYLDGPGIPMRYKLRKPKGQPVPLEVVAAMVAAVGEHPWTVRDRMLREMGWLYKPRVLGG